MTLSMYTGIIIMIFTSALSILLALGRTNKILVDILSELRRNK